MTNKHNRVLYTGVTGDLLRRVYEHPENLHEGVHFPVLKLHSWYISKSMQTLPPR